MNSAPNILYILADDLGWGDLSCHGSSIRTPTFVSGRGDLVACRVDTGGPGGDRRGGGEEDAGAEL